MTESLKQVMEQVEQLPPAAQDAIAAVIRRELAGQEQRRLDGLRALEELNALREELRREGYPSVDAVRLVREGREELEQRSMR